ncbi:hypothetical protein HYT84_02555 [Candidatus Micrarchaeota archaeon]|nr:hypothetical protein [Candidatus Micrarchaeota archaeon]
MKTTEENVDEGFEEVQPEQKTSGGNRPDFRVVQADRDKDGNAVYKNVGGMWKNVSKSGNEFYTLYIGKLKLLVFKNTGQFAQSSGESTSDLQV